MIAKYKYYFVAIAVCIWAVVFFVALRDNPTVNDSKARLSLMKAEMTILLQQGGKVLHVQGNAKYGGASLSYVMSDEGWDTTLLRKYQNTLVAQEWKQVESQNIAYCKNEILLRIVQNEGVVDGVNAHYIGMAYDAATIRRCSGVK